MRARTNPEAYAWPACAHDYDMPRSAAPPQGNPVDVFPWDAGDRQRRDRLWAASAAIIALGVIGTVLAVIACR